jgi:hypothetical protein
MNLRISKDQLRFRIAKEELAELLMGNDICLEPPLSSKQKYFVMLDNIETPLLLREEENKIILAVNKKYLEGFSEQLPSREGIEHEFQINGRSVKLVLEVDVRKSIKL